MAAPTFDECFEYLPTYGVLRCRRCRYAVAPQYLLAHLRRSHANLPAAARRSIAKEALLLGAASTPDAVRHPPHGQPPVPGFAISNGALQCADDSCAYVCLSLRGMQRHCRDRHAWINSQKRGGDKRAQHSRDPNAPWTHGVSCQTFFREPSWLRFFRVQASTSTPSTPRLEDGKRAFFDAQSSAAKALAHDAAEGDDAHKAAVSPWLQTLGIAAHLAHLPFDQIKQAVALPQQDDEPVAYAAAAALDALVRRAHASCITPGGHMSQPVQLALARFFTTAEPTVRAKTFRFRKERKTLDDYISTGKRLLAYLARVPFAEDEHFQCDARGDTLPDYLVEAPEEAHACWDTIASRPQQSAVEAAVLALWMSLIKQELGSRSYSSPLVSFCAMLAIRTGTGAWHEPQNFNKYLSAAIWLTQLLVFYDCSLRADEAGGSALPLVRQVVDTWISREAETAIGELLRWRLLLFHVGRNTVAAKEAYWDEAEEVITYGGTTLPLCCIPTLLASEHSQAHRLLYEDLLLGDVRIRRLRSSELHDNAAVDHIGWHLALHPENAELLGDYGDALLHAIRDSDALSAVYLQAGDAYSWRPGALDAYERRVQRFLGHLCVLVHISSGQPLRAPELLSATWRNTQLRRSVSLCLGRVMIHTKYDKTRATTGLDRDNIRFLPPPLGDMLLDFLVYVQPLRQVFLQQSCEGALLSPYLWQRDGAVWRDARLGDHLHKACASARVPSLGVGVWRQMTVAIVKTKFAADLAYFDIGERDDDGEEVDEDIRAMTAQRNHKTRTANRAYANQAGAAYGGAWDGLIRRGLRASQKWQAFLGADAMLRTTKRPASSAGGRLAKLQASGLHRPRRFFPAEELLLHMRRLHGDGDMEWRSPEQRDAMLAVTGREESVVAVLPTGAGKTMLYALPCTLPGAACTVLVVPLVALRVDLLRRLDALRIDSLEWRVGERREAALVIVTVEAAATSDFLEYAQHLAARHRLDRIVLDECHLTVTAAAYRRSFASLAELRVVRTQFVYLSATLPPCVWDEFLQRSHLVQPLVVRASANRPNIEYSVERAPPANFLDFAVARAKGLRGERCGPADKVVLYAQTIEAATRLADMLLCPAYTSRSGTVEEKGRMLAAWIASREQPFIVATAALAEGFDYPHIRAVVNVGPPDSLAQLAQQSGRAGRSGEPARSVVLLSPGWTRSAAAPSDPIPTALAADESLREQHDRAAVQLYVELGGCLRAALSRHLDLPEHQRLRCTPPDEPCQVCRNPPRTSTATPARPIPKAPPIVPPGLVAVQRAKDSEASELDEYIDRLSAASGTCLLCRGKGSDPRHAFLDCPGRGAVFTAKKEANRRGRRRDPRAGWLQPYTACFRCLNPQHMCGAPTGGKCGWEDTVLPLCVGVFSRPGGRSWLERSFGRAFDDEDAFIDWLGEATRFGGDKAVQGVRVAALALADFPA